MVLKRTYADIRIDNQLIESEAKHDTYYIYDQFGNLTYVIPPLAEGDASQTKLDYLGYQYKYDSRNRLVEKKLPGKEWEFIVYDKLDRPIATGPAYNPYGAQTKGWMITQYDVFGRVTQTGWKQMNVTDTERNNNQETTNAGGNPFVLTEEQILTKNFYDNYSFAGAPTMPQTVEGQGAVTNVKGLPTGSWVRVLDDAGSTTAEISYTLYDYKYRPIRGRTTNFLGGYTEVDSKIDWAGKVDKVVTKHKYNTTATVLTTTETFTYSPQDKLVLHKHKINTGNEELISKNNCDELGQLIRKEVGGQDFTGVNSYQKVDYKYNIRGWLKEINNIDCFHCVNTDNDLFAFKINYDEGTSPLYNGNISETYWKSGSDGMLRKYEYSYDKLNRLLEANYSKPSDSYNINPPLSTLDSYMEKLSYDKNGNILTLKRNGDLDASSFAIEIDNLVYTYDDDNKNQLKKVLDQSNHPQGFKDDSNGIEDQDKDYTYDDFGNLLTDTNKEISSIIYNHLNLPVQITFVNGNY
ncbi:MAG: RHS repeat-associated core domain-containing protein, partial [Candidatus Sericytochromatia bacterium]